MATRTFCDHCGNTCRSPNKFRFGPYSSAQTMQAEIEHSFAKAMAGSAQSPYPGAVQAVQAAVAQAQQPKHPTKIVDLCDTCAPIWYERVDKLCRASDPE